MLNKYSKRAKFHLISRNEGRDTSKLRGVGLFKEFDIQAKGKLEAADVRSTKNSTSLSVLNTALLDICCVSLPREWDDIYDIISLFRVSCKCSNVNHHIQTLWLVKSCSHTLLLILSM